MGSFLTVILAGTMLCLSFASANEKGCPECEVKKKTGPSVYEHILKALDVHPSLQVYKNLPKIEKAAHEAHYKRYILQKAKENRAIMRCNKEDPKKPSKFCVDMGKKFLKDLEDGATRHAMYIQSLIDDCKKAGRTPIVMPDFFDCPPAKAPTPAGEPVRTTDDDASKGSVVQ